MQRRSPDEEGQWLDRLVQIVGESTDLMRALRAARALQLSAWCIGAGAIRNRVWDQLHGFAPSTLSMDLDMVFHDPSDTSTATEHALAQRLQLAVPDMQWEVVNQAAPHHLFQSLGTCPENLEEGVASWPEFATCVGVFLDNADRIRIIAPHGLHDLFNLQVRGNPTRLPHGLYEKRLWQKQFQLRWPRLTVHR